MRWDSHSAERLDFRVDTESCTKVHCPHSGAVRDGLHDGFSVDQTAGWAFLIGSVLQWYEAVNPVAVCMYSDDSVSLDAINEPGLFDA